LLYELTYILATTLVKLSIATFLLHFTLERVQIYILYCVIAINIAYSIFLFFFALLQCRPISEFWLRVVSPPHGSCTDPETTIKVTYAHAAIVCVTDSTLAIIPIFIVRKMTLNFRTKCYVAVILALGSM
jgi:hypothetical protein